METPRITTSRLDEAVWLLELIGEHDLASVSDLQAALAPIFERGTCIILDLSQTTFIDSTILGEIIRTHERAQSTPGEELVVVAPPGTAAARVFELTDMHRLVTVRNTRQAAVDCCGATERATSTTT